MTRSGYTDECEHLELYRGAVDRAVHGKRGQAFLRELADAMDAMSEKILISETLIDEDGRCCAIGVVCNSRSMDVSKVDEYCPYSVGKAVGIARCLAAEIAYENDEGSLGRETPEQRWVRMREWVASKLTELDRRNGVNNDNSDRR